MKRSFSSAFTAGVLLIFLAALAAATWIDLPLSQALYQPNQTWAIYLEAMGFYPFYFPALLWLLGLANDAEVKGSIRTLCTAAFTAATALMAYSSYHHLESRSVQLAFVPVCVVWTILLFGYVFILAAESRCNAAWRKRERFGFFWGTVYMLLGNIIIHVIKPIWNRARFDEMMQQADFSNFTPWYQPFGAGGSSFPSGHTAAACGLIFLVFICDAFPQYRKYRKFILILCSAYIAAMAASRIIIGRHFLSDTVAACLIMAGIFLLMRRSKMYREMLDKLPLAESDAPEKEIE